MFILFPMHASCASADLRCKERYYDEKALSQHYSRTHFCCHICDKLQRPNKWFRDYQVCFICEVAVGLMISSCSTCLCEHDSVSRVCSNCSLFLASLLQSLDVHYGRDHWACHDPKCKERRFVAFEDEFQLTLHVQVWHIYPTPTHILCRLGCSLPSLSILMKLLR